MWKWCGVRIARNVLQGQTELTIADGQGDMLPKMISVPTEKGKTMAKIGKDVLKIGVTFTKCNECNRVEVTYCKDCVFGKVDQRDELFCDRPRFQAHFVKPYDFCSYGISRSALSQGEQL